MANFNAGSRHWSMLSNIRGNRFSFAGEGAQRIIQLKVPQVLTVPVRRGGPIYLTLAYKETKVEPF